MKAKFINDILNEKVYSMGSLYHIEKWIKEMWEKMEAKFSTDEELGEFFEKAEGIIGEDACHFIDQQASADFLHYHQNGPHGGDDTSDFIDNFDDIKYKFEELLNENPRGARRHGRFHESVNESYTMLNLLSKVKKDWGEDSDLYGELEEDVLGGNIEDIKATLENYDVYDEYKRYVKTNEAFEEPVRFTGNSYGSIEKSRGKDTPYNDAFSAAISRGAQSRPKSKTETPEERQRRSDREDAREYRQSLRNQSIRERIREIEGSIDEIDGEIEDLNNKTKEGPSWEIEEYFGELGTEASNLVNSGLSDEEKIKGLTELGIEDPEDVMDNYYYYYPGAKLSGKEISKIENKIKELTAKREKLDDRKDKLEAKLYESVNESIEWQRGNDNPEDESEDYFDEDEDYEESVAMYPASDEKLGELDELEQQIWASDNSEIKRKWEEESEEILGNFQYWGELEEYDVDNAIRIAQNLLSGVINEDEEYGDFDYDTRESEGGNYIDTPEKFQEFITYYEDEIDGTCQTIGAQCANDKMSVVNDILAREGIELETEGWEDLYDEIVFGTWDGEWEGTELDQAKQELTSTVSPDFPHLGHERGYPNLAHEQLRKQQSKKF